MHKFVKITGIIALLLIVIAAGSLAYLWFNKDGFVRRGTEYTLENILKVDVKVASAHVDLGAGRVTFGEIVIGNPDGYKSDYAMKLKEIEVVADVSSLQTNQPVIHLIRVANPIINYELNGTTSNIARLQKNAESASDDGVAEEPQGEEKQMVIDRVLIQQPAFLVALPLIESEPVGITMDDVEVNDIGKGDPVTSAEATQMVMKELLHQAEKAGAKALKGGAQIAGDTLEAMRDSDGTLKDAADKVSDTATNAADQVEDAAKKAGDFVRDTVGGKKK